MIKREDKLKKMLEDERARVVGYEQIAKVHSAYIGILLQRFGAVKDNGVKITGTQVKEAMAKLEVRALPEEDGFTLYIESKE